MTEHSIWGGAAPPWEPSAESDGTPSIRTAVAFYATATTWYVTGARLRAPAASGFGTVTLSLWITANGGMPDLSSSPVASAQVVVGAGAGWYDARWDDAVELTPPDAAWISLEDGTRYLFVASATVGPDFVQASDAADLYLAEATHPRSAYDVGTDPTASSQSWYGIDVIVSDEPDPPPAGGSVATIGLSASGAGRARHSGASAASLGVAAVGQGFKRASGGSVATLGISSAGAGYNPADPPDSLPDEGTLISLTPTRGLVPLTPRRGLETA